MSRWTVASLAALVLGSASLPVQAAGVAAAPASGAVDYAKLPAGHATLPTDATPPASIGAGEKISGFFVSKPEWPNAPKAARPDFVLLTGEPVDPSGNPFPRKRFRMKRGAKAPARDEKKPTPFCFVEDVMRGAVSNDDEGDSKHREWIPNLNPQVAVSLPSAERHIPAVQSVHAERFLEGDSGPVLEMVDAWVDPATRGVRQIARSVLSLVDVAEPFGGNRVYAARDGEVVHVVVRALDRNDVPQNLSVVLPDGMVGSGSCGHVRAALRTKKGEGETATFLTNAFFFPDKLAIDAFKQKREAVNRDGGDFDLNDMPQLRFRPLHIQASTSWTSRDKAPMVSLSFGWEGREKSTTMPIED